MIRTETEYQEAVRRLAEEEERLVEHETRLREMGLGTEEVKRALDPFRSFHLQLGEEVESYERLKRGDLGELSNLHGLGRTLVALRIALGLTQRELASRLGVHESQVSRDERNEYHGITVERASRILDAFGVHLTSQFESPLGAAVEYSSEPMKRWLGIDFSGAAGRWGPQARSSNVWIADVLEARPVPVLRRLDRVQSWAEGQPPFEWLIRFLADEGFSACAIDAPFSIPSRFLPAGGHRALLEQVGSIPRGRRPFPRAEDFVEAVRGSGPHPELKPLRATEKHWSALGLNVRSTLWAGPRGGAAMTAACLTLLGEVPRPIWPFQAAGRAPFLAEAFPMAQLRQWRLPHQTYGASAELDREIRRRIVAELRRFIDLAGHAGRLEASADAIDAVLCAFAAIAITEDRLAVPVPPGEIAGTEGWIAVHDGRPTQATADRSTFAEAMEEGAEAARRGDVVPHLEAVRLLKSSGR